MSQLLIWLAFLACASLATSNEDCPMKYLRFTQNPTYCLRRNPNCDIVKAGIDSDDIKRHIVNVHNEQRSKVATGKEGRGGGLPSATNMMQMEWDDELAKIAQSWAEQCKWEHDCNPCRTTPDYYAGQNMAKGGASSPNADKNRWTDMVNMWYNEIDIFDKKNVDSFTFSKSTGHFTQNIWADSWRVGCGFTAYKEGGSITHFFVCNYGPGGNVGGAAIYKSGTTCSSCPTNSCCGNSCRGGMGNYPGLCKMLDVNKAPMYPEAKGDFSMNCDFTRDNSPDCQNNIKGVNNWKAITSLSGNYRSITLNGGEESTMEFTKEIIIKPQDKFCIRPYFRKSPLIAGNNDESKLEAKFYLQGNNNPITLNLQWTTLSFSPYSIDLSWGTPTKVALTFSVPKNAKPHILDIKKVVAFNDKCGTRNA